VTVRKSLVVVVALVAAAAGLIWYFDRDPGHLVRVDWYRVVDSPPGLVITISAGKHDRIEDPVVRETDSQVTVTVRVHSPSGTGTLEGYLYDFTVPLSRPLDGRPVIDFRGNVVRQR